MACRSSWTKQYNNPLATTSEPESSSEPGADGVSAVEPIVRQSPLPSHRRLAALQQPAFGRPLSAIPEAVSPRGAGNLPPGSRAGSPLLLGGSRGSTPSSVESPPSLDWGDREITSLGEEDAGEGPQLPLAATSVAADAASPLLPAVWRGIGQVVPQLRAMLRQTRVATALVMVMSAISLEAGEVWEARRRLKRLLKVTAAEQRWQQGDDVGSSAVAVHTTGVHTSDPHSAGIEKQRDTAAARSASLLQHVTSLNELFLSALDGQPEEAAVMALLSELKVARIRAAARGALGARQQRIDSASNGPASGMGPAAPRSALGLPSLALRKRVASPKTSASFSSETGAAELLLEETDKELPVLTAGDDDLLSEMSSSAAAATAAILGQLESRALKYSRAFESFSTRLVNAAAASAAAGGAVSLEVAMAQQQQQMESRASRYLAGFGAVSRRFASRQPPPPQQQGAPGAALAGPEAAAAAPIGIPALPPRKKKQAPSKPKPKGGMKARRQAQAQVDEKKWKATSKFLA